MVRDKFSVGLIGYGHIGELHAEVCANLPEVELAAIADKDSKRWTLAFEKFRHLGCKIFGDTEEMLREVPLDIAVVATQAPDHYLHVMAALNAGCHVICEKPFALDLQEADAMVETAKRKGIQLAVHHQHVFTPAAMRLKMMIDSGSIGELKFIHGWGKGRPAPYELMEIGVHVLNLMCFIAGEPQWVSGHIRQDRHDARKTDSIPLDRIFPQGRHAGLGFGDNIHAEYGFASGPIGLLRLTNLTMAGGHDKDVTREWAATEFQGTKGRLRVHHLPPGYLLYKPTPEDDFDTLSWEPLDNYPLRVGERSWFITTRDFFIDFLHSITEERKPIVSGEDGRLALEMALGIYASHLAGGKRLALPLLDRTHPLK